MRTGRFDQVVVVQSMSTSASHLPPGMLDGILAGLAERGVSLGVAKFNDEQLAQDVFVPRTLAEMMCDGFLLNYDTNIPPAMLAVLARHRTPVVWINSRQPADCVHPDDHAAGRLATEHLLALGHRRIVYADLFVSHTTFCHYSRHDRRQGYRDALAAAGLPAWEWCPARVPDDPAEAAASALLAPSHRATAVVGYSIFEISTLQRAAALRGLRLPQDLSLVVIDDGQVFSGHRLTTVAHDIVAVGRLAAERLLDRVAASRRRPPVVVAPRLLPGRSTASPASVAP